MPRAKRSTVATAEEPQTPPEAKEAPKCASCGHELDWRDRAYVPAPKPAEDAAAVPVEGKPTKRKKKAVAPAPVAPTAVCKRCHQRNWHARLGVVAFHPATTRFTRAARRGHGSFAEQRIAHWGERQAQKLIAKRMRRVARARAAHAAA